MRTYVLVLFMLALVLLAVPAKRLKAQDVQGTIWELNGIAKTPDYQVTGKDSVLAIIYKGLRYRGNDQQVFAYYATPGMVKGDTSLDQHLPGIVLVHGGGGKAFKEWAIMWARKGYAAIAMDLRGNGPDGKPLKHGFQEINGTTPYFKITPDLSGQWMFQAVANVLLAHNLLRSFPEVDTARTAITGISWGGVITCIMAGLDNRYKAAVPVYGSGFLNENGRMKKNLGTLTSTDRAIWLKQYDPSHYLPKAMMPILFINGASDPYFVLESYAKTYNLVQHKALSIKVGLKHSHRHAWQNQETYRFINHHINGTPPLPAIKVYKKNDSLIKAIIQGSSTVKKAFLHYTTDIRADYENRKWHTIEAELDRNQVTAPMPLDDTVIWYLSILERDEIAVSSKLHFPQDQH